MLQPIWAGPAVMNVAMLCLRSASHKSCEANGPY